MAQILGAESAERLYSDFQRRHPIKYYWLTAGLCGLIVAIIGLGNSSGQPAYGGGGGTQQGMGGMGAGPVPSGFPGRWQGTLSSPGYGSNRVEMDLRASDQYHVLGQIFNDTTGCTSDVAGTITGTALALNLTQRWVRGYCGGSATAEARLQGNNSLWMTLGGFAVPLSGTLTRGLMQQEHYL